MTETEDWKRKIGRPANPKAAEAYKLRCQGKSWVEIADLIGLDRLEKKWKRASSLAKAYAKEQCLDWPVSGKKQWPSGTRKKSSVYPAPVIQAYALRESGLSWRDVADRTGITTERKKGAFYISQLVKVYALKEGLKWPVRPDNSEKFPGGRGGRKRSPERAATLKQAYALRQSGLPWLQIAEHTGITNKRGKGGFLIANLVRKYALKEGLDWPIGLDNSVKHLPEGHPTNDQN